MHAYKHFLREGIDAQKIQLSVTNIRVLKSICRRPQSTAHSISQRMQRDKAQITRALNDLIDADLIKKAENPKDRRSQLLVPTPKGKTIMTKLDKVESEAEQRLTRGMKPEDLATFLRLSNAMADKLDLTSTDEGTKTS